MNFAQVAKKSAQTTYTENGAVAYNTTNKGDLLDLFAIIGSMRSRTANEIEEKFEKAFYEDNSLATKMLFYAGDIRNGGLGERRTFRICLKWLARRRPDIVLKNIDNIAYYNRYDSLFELVDTDVEPFMWQYIGGILTKDLKACNDAHRAGEEPTVSLLAKWMPSENANSQNTRQLARRAMQHLHLKPRRYRRMLSALRYYIKVVETKMSSGQWDKIDYPSVPSYAMKNYNNAFMRHDVKGFSQYINDLEKGKTKINASTLYPYDLVHKYIEGTTEYQPIVEEQWKALPDYIGDASANFLVMADVSGSMRGRPLETSIGLATYFAQHNHGDYRGLYMTFTNQPHFVCFNEHASLRDCIKKAIDTDVGYNTNLDAAFSYVLNHAVECGVKPEDMPKALVVISDMEIDPYFHINDEGYVRGYYTHDYSLDFVEKQRAKFKWYGYELPKLVLWNVESRNDIFLSQDENVVFVSGQSASSFKHLVESLNGKTAYEFMVDVLNSPAYDRVIV